MNTDAKTMMLTECEIIKLRGLRVCKLRYRRGAREALTGECGDAVGDEGGVPRVFIRRGRASRVIVCLIAFNKRVGATRDATDAFLIWTAGLVRFPS